MAITKEQVWQAASRLSKDGQRPTLAAVRELVGGSYSTLSPLLKQWRERQAARRQPGAEPPPAVVERGAAATRAIWSVAERLAAERAELDRRREAAEADRAEAVALADSLAEKLDAVRAALDRARQETARTQAELDRARREERSPGRRAGQSAGGAGRAAGPPAPVARRGPAGGKRAGASGRGILTETRPFPLAPDGCRRVRWIGRSGGPGVESQII